MLAGLTTLCLQLAAVAADQRRQVFAQLAATQEAANLLERAQSLDWNDLASAAKLQLSTEARETLPESRAEVIVNEPSDQPPGRRLTVAVYWRPQPGEPEHQVRLVAWRYKQP
jgi:hypothetical protein